MAEAGVRADDDARARLLEFVVDPPLQTAALPGVGGRLRACVSDFRVVELPAYTPDDREDAHLMFTLRKRGLTTEDALAELARQLEIPRRDIGLAGLKDRHAITDGRVLVDHHARHDQAIRTDAHVRADHHGRMDLRSIAHDGFGAVPGLTRHGGAHQLVVLAAGVGTDDDGLARRWFHLLVDEDGGGRTVQRLVVVLLMVHEDQVAGLHAVDLVQPGDQDRGVAFGRGADLRGERFGGAWWVEPHGWRQR